MYEEVKGINMWSSKRKTEKLFEIYFAQNHYLSVLFRKRNLFASSWTQFDNLYFYFF
jgi:hypothetical protein